MAVPHKEHKRPSLAGPFVAKLSKSDIQVNLAGESSKRYLVMQLNAEYFALDEMYVAARLGVGAGDGHGGEAKEDPLYMAMLKDAILKIAAARTRDQVSDPAQMDAFLEDIRKAVNPILFPVCVGDSHGQSIPDSESGVRVGESIMQSTLRGFLHDHKLVIDGPHKTIRLDDGPDVKFEGDEQDLQLKNKEGKTVFVDLSNMKSDFSGELPIGVPGKLRRIYRESFLIQ
jgi:hypothetical protein